MIRNACPLQRAQPTPARHRNRFDSTSFRADIMLSRRSKAVKGAPACPNRCPSRAPIIVTSRLPRAWPTGGALFRGGFGRVHRRVFSAPLHAVTAMFLRRRKKSFAAAWSSFFNCKMPPFSVSRPRSVNSLCKLARCCPKPTCKAVGIWAASSQAPRWSAGTRAVVTVDLVHIRTPDA